MTGTVPWTDELTTMLEDLEKREAKLTAWEHDLVMNLRYWVRHRPADEQEAGAGAQRCLGSGDGMTGPRIKRHAVALVDGAELRERIRLVWNEAVSEAVLDALIAAVPAAAAVPPPRPIFISGVDIDAVHRRGEK